MKFYKLDKYDKLNRILNPLGINVKENGENIEVYEMNSNILLYTKPLANHLPCAYDEHHYIESFDSHDVDKAEYSYEPYEIDFYGKNITDIRIWLNKKDEKNGFVYKIESETFFIWGLPKLYSSCAPFILQRTNLNDNSYYRLKMDIGEYNTISFEEQLANGKKLDFYAEYLKLKGRNNYYLNIFENSNNIGFDYVLKKDAVIKKILRKTTPDIFKCFNLEQQATDKVKKI